MKYIAHLGRQPEIGLAELESRLTAEAIEPFSKQVCRLSSSIDIDSYGGVVRVAEVLTSGSRSQWKKLLEKQIDIIAAELPANFGKLKLGFSAIDIKLSTRELNTVALQLKKRLKSKNHSVRVVPNKAQELNAAQVLYNKLTDEKGRELLIVGNQDEIIIARTLSVQDIDAYAERDREKPVRDAEVGMLPPKLAQILINLTATPSGRLLDPFCGTGTLLMEAALLGYDVYGSDIAPRMSSASQTNLDWLAKRSDAEITATIETADAMSHTWQQPVDTVASETYLGPPLHELPEYSTLQKIIIEIDSLHREFLKNMHKQLASGSRIVLAAPAWKSKNNRITSLPVVDDLEKMGYNPIRFEYVNSELIYARPDQVVARQILVLVRK